MKIQYFLPKKMDLPLGFQWSPPSRSSIFSLPPELLQQIIDELDTEIDATLFLLRRTHRIFYNSISPANVRGHQSQGKALRQHRFVHAAHLADYRPDLFAEDTFSCFLCLRFLSGRHFTDEVVGKSLFDRHCIDCERRIVEAAAAAQALAPAPAPAAEPARCCVWKAILSERAAAGLWPCRSCGSCVLYFGIPIIIGAVTVPLLPGIRSDCWNWLLFVCGAFVAAMSAQGSRRLRYHNYYGFVQGTIDSCCSAPHFWKLSSMQLLSRKGLHRAKKQASSCRSADLRW